MFLLSSSLPLCDEVTKYERLLTQSEGGDITLRRRKGSNSKLGMTARLYFFFFFIRQKVVCAAAVMTSSGRTAIVTPEKVEGSLGVCRVKKDNERGRERAR